MANEKISQMPAISSFATGDLLPIVDISEVSASDKNKSVTFGALFQNVLGGSAAAPSIAFTGDQNTGIYSPGSDQLAVATNGSERLRITSTGLVGIGTSSPNSILTVAGGPIETNRTFYNRMSSGVAVADRGLLFEIDGTQYGRVYSPNGKSVAIQAGAGTLSDALTVDQSGRVGIGTTSPSVPLQVTGQIRALDGGVDLRLSPTLAGIIGTYSNHDVPIYTNGSEKARIDSSGRLLVGTSSGQGNSFLQIKGDAGGSTGIGSIFLQRGLTVAAIGSSGNVDLAKIEFGNQDGAVGAVIQANADAAWSTNDYPSRLTFSTTADGASSPTERMRITNTGAIRTFSSAGDESFSARSSSAAGTTFALLVGRHSATDTASGTVSFAVYTNGNVVNTNNSYGALSDIKLKENIVDANSQWDDIKALQVRKYNFKEGQTHTQIGLVAQEVELVSPGLVSESPDRDAEGNDLGTVTKSVNYSVLYMKAVKALQEAMERIETLEAKVAALESA